MKRDGITIELVKQRIKNQWTDEQRMELADFIIHNNDDEMIIPQIIDIDYKLRTNG
jgi:dephospho-CoA kinase